MVYSYHVLKTIINYLYMSLRLKYLSDRNIHCVHNIQIVAYIYIHIQYICIWKLDVFNIYIYILYSENVPMVGHKYV